MHIPFSSFAKAAAWFILALIGAGAYVFWIVMCFQLAGDIAQSSPRVRSIVVIGAFIVSLLPVFCLYVGYRLTPHQHARQRAPLRRARLRKSAAHLNALRLVSGFRTSVDFSKTEEVEPGLRVTVFIPGTQTVNDSMHFRLQCTLSFTDNSEFWHNGGKIITTRHIYRFSKWSNTVHRSLELEISDMLGNHYGKATSEWSPFGKLKRKQVRLSDRLNAKLGQDASDADLNELVYYIELVCQRTERPSSSE